MTGYVFLILDAIRKLNKGEIDINWHRFAGTIIFVERQL